MPGFDTTTLANGITLISRQNPGTPRTAFNIFIDGGNRVETIPGVSDIASRLLLKGTTNRSAEDIAVEADTYAIDIDIDVKQDFIKIRAVFLNEDIDRAIDIVSDLIQNSTFEQFDKEKYLLEGELTIELDSPRSKATDLLIKTMYPEHPYGTVASVMLENINNISKDDTINYYKKNFNGSSMSIICVGDYSQEQLVKRFEDKLQSINTGNSNVKDCSLPCLTKNIVVTTTKDDASQAQILRGWHGPLVTSQDYVSLLVLNNILGSAGLSSRLFVELRDKKGLAYAVRSSIETLKFSSNITTYIGTEPKNIEVALKGFDEEIQKLINEPVSTSELDAAKKNIIGKRAVFHETNSQQCSYLGLYHILGAGAEYDNKIPDLIKSVTIDDIQMVAQKYLTQKHVTSILAPSQSLACVTG